MAVASEYRELVESLEREWRKALCAKDIDRLRTLIHPKFTMIGTSSTGPFTLTRDEWLGAIQKRKLLRIETEIRDAVVLDKTIVGTIEARWHVSYLGRELEDSVLLTDVWVYDNDRWQVVRRHLSPIPTSGAHANGHA